MMNAEVNFRHIIEKVAQGLNSDNVKMIAYLCMDCIPSGRIFSNSIEIFDLFEVKGLISSTEMSFLAEVLYRINRHDLLKQLPGVKNRRDYEENFLQQQRHQNFTPYRIACLRLVDELTKSDFQTLRNLCKDKLSSRNYQRSIDVLSLLICLEEEDYMSDGDLEFILSSLQHLDNQIPFRIFERLRQGDTSITLPTRHPSAPNLAANNLPFPKSKGFTHSQSLRHSNHGNLKTFSTDTYTCSHDAQPHSFNAYTENRECWSNIDPCNDIGVSAHKSFVDRPYKKDYRPTNGNRSYSGFDCSKNFPCTRSFPIINSEDSKAFGTSTSKGTQPLLSHGQSFSYLKTFMESSDKKGRFRNDKHQTFSDVNCRLPLKRFSCPNESRNAYLMTSPLTNDTEMARMCVKDMPASRLQNLEEKTILYENILSKKHHQSIPEIQSAQFKESNPVNKTFFENNPPNDKVSLTTDLTNMDCYPMKKNPHGICLIINNCSFESSDVKGSSISQKDLGSDPSVILKERLGSQRDVENIKDLFGSLGFVVEIYSDLTTKDMKKTITDFSHKDHSNYDCFVVFIMSHGLEGSVYGVDGLQVSCTQIVKTFRPDKCPSLLDKPKIFFFQACQGDRKMGSHSAPVAAGMDIETDSPQKDYVGDTPTEADFLIAHSTVPGYMSYRHKKNGSLFIDGLIKNLKKYHRSEDLLSIMIKVNDDISTQPFKQMPMPIATLRKKVYFRIPSCS